jgi:hypothetical protein
MPCELKEDKVTKFSGTTLFSKGKCTGMPTGVYIPPKHLDTTNPVNVVIWLHGWEVKNIEFLFNGDPARARDTVLKSTKDVVLIAPFLGHKYGVYVDGNLTEVKGSLSTDDLGEGKWGENYLDEVLNALARFQNSKKDPPEKKPLPILIKNLVIACHSGGGTGMRNLVRTLGKYQPKLKQCWGFDCLYDSVDATFWSQRMSGPDACPLWIFYGPSTLPQSVKLDLIGRGKADLKGNKADPPGPKIKDLHVIHSHYEAYATSGQSAVDEAVDRILSAPPPTPPPLHRGKHPPTPAKAKDGDFVKQAADKMRAYYAFQDDVHYFIAKYFFLTQLRNAAFLG